MMFNLLFTKNKKRAVRFPPLGGCREGFSGLFYPYLPFPKEGIAQSLHLTFSIK